MNYTQVEINARLQGVVDTIGAGNIIIRAAATNLVTFQLPAICGTVADGVLTFSPGLSTVAANTGFADNAVIQDGLGTNVVTGITVGSSTQLSADIIIGNTLNSTLISSGQTITLTSAKITGAS